jgi:hypothetical protein
MTDHRRTGNRDVERRERFRERAGAEWIAGAEEERRRLNGLAMTAELEDGSRRRGFARLSSAVSQSMSARTKPQGAESMKPRMRHPGRAIVRRTGRE